MGKTKFYVARDADNALCAYPDPPKKDVFQGVWVTDGIGFTVINNMEKMIPELEKVNWSDKKPQMLTIEIESKNGK